MKLATDKPFKNGPNGDQHENNAWSATKQVRPFRRGGFTLIELILVMALIAVVLGLVLPSLSRFFRGRTLDLEARRFLSLTRLGQSRAVSEGVPILLWMDPRRGAYGLKAESTYTSIDTNAIVFALDKSVAIQPALPMSNNAVNMQGLKAQVPGGATTIRFTPDGFLDDTSPLRIAFRQNDLGEIWIAQSSTRLNYEIVTNYWNRPR